MRRLVCCPHCGSGWIVWHAPPWHCGRRLGWCKKCETPFLQRAGMEAMSKKRAAQEAEQERLERKKKRSSS